MAQPKTKLTKQEREAKLAELREQSRRVSALLSQKFKEMGFDGEPIGAEKLQELMRQDGIDPEACEFSRAIIEERNK